MCAYVSSSYLTSVSSTQNGLGLLVGRLMLMDVQAAACGLLARFQVIVLL